MNHELSEHEESSATPAVGRTVAVGLPCVRCGYDLRGLKAGGVCPECGLEVRRTLLFVVDPARSRIAPLRDPAAAGRRLIVIAGLIYLAALLLWSPHVIEAYARGWEESAIDLASRAQILTAIAGACGIFAVLVAARLHRPLEAEAEPSEYHRGLRRFRLGILGWSFLLFALAIYDLELSPPTAVAFGVNEIDLARTGLRFALTATAILAVSGIQPVVRLVELRSLSHRTGRVSRQGFAAMTLALIVVGGGDLVRLVVATLEERKAPDSVITALGFGSLILILIGAAMVTLALASVLLDAFRLRRGMNRRAYTLDELLEPGSGLPAWQASADPVDELSSPGRDVDPDGSP